MALPWRSRFAHGANFLTTWQPALPVRPWLRKVPTVGGSQRSATGVQAAYLVRRDHNMLLTVRFLEHEWPDLDGLIAWGQSGETFLWYPATSGAGSYLVDLESPAAGNAVEPTRSVDYPRAHELTLELHRMDGVAWDLEYFPMPTGGLPWIPRTP